MYRKLLKQIINIQNFTYYKDLADCALKIIYDCRFIIHQINFILKIYILTEINF